MILVPAFAFQLLKLLKKGKHTIGFSPLSWTLNFSGRYLWIIFAFLAIASLEPENATWKAVAAKDALLFGQAAISMMTVPILYYSFRNKNTEGQYTKEHFKKKLFWVRLGLGLMTFISMAIFGVLLNMTNNGITFSEESRKAMKIIVVVIGFAAAIMTGVAFLPQGMKTIKSKKTTSTSILLSSCFAIGNTLIILSFIVDLAMAPTAKLHDPLYVLMDLAVIIFPSISTTIMYIITFIKAKNMIKNGEK